MTINVKVSDGRGKNVTGHVIRRDEISGPVVYVRDFAERTSATRPFLNPEYGNNLAQNAAFGGTPVRLHDGIDSTLWTGSQISGTKVTFNSTDVAQAGTRSVKIDNPNLADTWEFSKGSSQALSSYTAISGYVNIDKDWTAGDSISFYGWDGALVGNEVFIEDYINISLFDEWQDFAIPLAAMGLSTATVDAFRMSQAGKAGKAGKWYLDEFILQETGGDIEFCVSPDARTVFYIESIRFTFVDNVTGNAALAYDKILGVSLTNGLVITRITKDGPVVGRKITSVTDFYSFGFCREVLQDDGTNTILVLDVHFDEPLTLNALYEETINIDLADDLSGFLVANAIARGRSENINTGGKLIK